MLDDAHLDRLVADANPTTEMFAETDAAWTRLLASGPPRRSLSPSRVVIPALATCGTAAAVAVVALTSVTSAPPAYAAVTHFSGGQRTVTITLREEQDISKLNARLEAEHTRIRVVPVVRGCDAPVHSVSDGEVVPGPAKTILAEPLDVGGHQGIVVSETIDVNTIAGRTFVVPDSRTGLHSGGDQVVVGPAPSCVGISPQ
jgi:hypothetical protein